MFRWVFETGFSLVISILKQSPQESQALDIHRNTLAMVCFTIKVLEVLFEGFSK